MNDRIDSHMGTQRAPGSAPAGNAETMIAIDGVSKRYGDFQALERVDMNIARGEFVVLLGASGCGKSTLLNLITGFDAPTTGKIRVNGREVKGIDPHCGMVFQQYALFPWLNVLDNVAFGLKMKGIDKATRYATARRYIEMVGLKGFEDRYPKALSGGMRQRVSIARVLANDPDVILLDEPFAALDAMTRQVLQEELLQIYQKSGKTIVFITHSIDEALMLSTRMVIMSARPGCVACDMQNDLPMPRDAQVQLSPRYNELKSQIWSTVQTEVMRSLESQAA
jgi:NitT/TauT family transport system ATP-binding protein